MKKWIVVLAICGIALPILAAEWLTDLPKAIAKAKADKKMVLIDFTGSDWCPPCMALHSNVLTSKEFESYADTNLVLVVVDFPQHKEQTEETKTANKALAQKYNIEGFPTIILLGPDGSQLTNQAGYNGQSAKDFIATLDQLKKTSTP